MKALHIEGRHWFHRTYGNTYHTVAIWVDGVRYTHFRGISEPASKSFAYIDKALDCFVETVDIVRKAH